MNLFFISSPFQLICAMEARAYFGCEQSILVLRDQENDLAEEHVDRILDESEWTHIVRLSKIPKKFGVPRLPALLNTIKKIQPDMTFERVFAAEYSSWRVSVIFANVKAEEEFMFDDGTLTLFEYEESIKHQKRVPVGRPRKDLILRLFGYKGARVVYPRPNFKLFTYFNIDSQTVPVFRNHFVQLKKRLHLDRVYDAGGDIAFVGDGGTSDEIDLNKYYESLSELCESHSDRKVYYFPHRNEEPRIREMLSSIKGLVYVVSDTPIELKLQELPNGVAAIYGSYSSAMFSLAEIYDRVPMYTRKLRQEELISNAYLLSRSIELVDQYLKGDNIHPWLRTDEVSANVPT
jgi:hypothetical protein